MFKIKKNISPEVMKQLFALKISHYDLCNNNSFKSRRVNSVWHGTESVSYLGPKIWDLAPNEIKESESLNGFKFKIKRWVPEGCPCCICKKYLEQVGLIITLKKQQLDFSEIKLHVITIIFAYKCSVISC